MDPVATGDESRGTRPPTAPLVPRRQGAPSPASHAAACAPPALLFPASHLLSATDDVPQRPTGLPMTIRVDGAQADCVDPHTLGAVYRITTLALGMLGQEHSVKQLVCIGATAVHVWGTGSPKKVIYPTTPCHDDGCRYMTPSDDEMGKWVRVYLDKVRHCFPILDVCHLGRRESGEEVAGVFEPRNWVQDAEDRCISAGKELSNENVMLHWDSLDAGVISTQAEAILRLAKLRSQHLVAEEFKDEEAARRYAIDYRTYLVDGANTLAHELVHCFVRFLAGDTTVGTPRRLMPKGFAYDDMPGKGESGRMWENLTFGGCFVVYQPRKRGGRPRLWINKGYREAEVDPDDIRNIVDGKMEFPVKTVGKWYRTASKRRP